MQCLKEKFSGKGYCETVIFMITYLFDRSSPETGPCTTERIGGKKIGWEEDESWETKSLILDKTSRGEINLLWQGNSDLRVI